MNKMLNAWPAVALLVCTSFGCARTLDVNVSGIQTSDAPVPEHVTYAVLATGEVEKDPNFETYGAFVAEQMNERGYRASDPRTAKLGVFLAYAVSDTTPQSTGGLSPQQTAGTGGATAGASAYGSAASSGDLPNLHRFVTQAVVVVADLERSRQSRQLVELWRGEARTTGHKADPLTVVPVMIEAAFRHFGEATGGPVHHAIPIERTDRKPSSP